jgi:hypothetical protein
MLGVIASVGPVIPRERSFLVLVGGGYVIGEFMATVVLPAVTTSLAAIHRRRIGVAFAAVALVAWGVGRASDPGSYPVMGAQPSLFDVGGWFGFGPVAVAAFAWLAFGHQLFASRNIDAENDAPESLGRSWGLVLAGIYLGLWLGLAAPGEP